MKKFTYLLYNIILYLFKLNFKIKFFIKYLNETLNYLVFKTSKEASIYNRSSIYLWYNHRINNWSRRVLIIKR